MPRGDRTGPMGMGPMTGRGAGFCSGYRTGGYQNTIDFGYGGGRGFRRMYYATGLPRWSRYDNQGINQASNTADYAEKELLKRHANLLENELYEV